MFTGIESQNITLAAGGDLTKKFRTIIAPLVGGIKGEYFSKAALLELLNQTDAVGARIYIGLSNDIVPLPKLVIVGVDTDENDLTSGKIVSGGYSCPPNCATTNVLNSTI